MLCSCFVLQLEFKRDKVNIYKCRQSLGTVSASIWCHWDSLTESSAAIWNYDVQCVLFWSHLAIDAGWKLVENNFIWNNKSEKISKFKIIRTIEIDIGFIMDLVIALNVKIFFLWKKDMKIPLKKSTEIKFT